MSDKTKKQGTLFLMITVLSLFSWSAHMNGTLAILADIAKMYPEVPKTSITMLSTIVSLVAIPFSMLSGQIVNKLGCKKTFIGFMLLLVVAGVAPAFVTSFSAVLTCRAFVGVAHGILYSLPNVMAAKAFEDQGQRSKVMGWGQLVNCICGIMISSASGFLATIDVRFAWYVYLIGILPIVFAFFYPEEKQWKQKQIDAPAKKEKASETVKEKMTGMTWLYIACTMLLVLFSYPFKLNVSYIITNELMASSVQSGYAMSFWIAGGALGSLIFGLLYQRIKGYAGAVGGICMGLGMLLCAVSNSLILIFAGAIIGGVGSVMMSTFLFLNVSLVTPMSKVATAMGIQTAVLNGTAFLSSYFYPFVNKLFGVENSLRFPFYVAVLGLVVLAVIFIATAKKQEKGK